MRDDLARFPTPSEAFGKQRKPSMPNTSPAYGSLGDIPPPPQQRFRNASDGTGIPRQHTGGSQQSYSGQSRPVPPPVQQSQAAPASQFQYLGQQQSHTMGFASPQPYDPNQYQQAPEHGLHHRQAPPPPPQQYRSHTPTQGAPIQQQYSQQLQQQQQQQQQQSRRYAPQQVSPQSRKQYAHAQPQAQPPAQPQLQQHVQPQMQPQAQQQMQPQGYQQSASQYPQRPSHQLPPQSQLPQSQSQVEHRIPRRPVQDQASSTSLPQGPLTPNETQPDRRKVKDANKVPDLRTLFDEVDRQKRGYLTERELSKALVNGDYSPFDTRTVRLMIRMFDRDGDGAIYFAEFGQLWKYLHEWRNIFDKFDADGSECITLEEFGTALKAFGYTLSATSVEFMFKAGSRLSSRNGLPEMSFDMFVQSCINIKSITDIFKRYDVDRDGYVTLSFEEFMMESTKLS